MAAKPRFAICWLGGCGGCDEAVVDLNEVILRFIDDAELILWPIAMDYKYHHVKALGDREITLSIVNGNIRNSENEEIAKLLRAKSQIVLAFGACACLGGTPGLANLGTREDIFNWVYRDAPTVVNPKGTMPQPKSHVSGKELTLPELYQHVYPLDRIIDIDYYLPGCPPPPDLVANAITAVLEHKLPPKGSTLAPHKSLCDTCKRNATKPARIALKNIKRIHEVEASPDLCFLAQEILCLGVATRGGCGEACININVPCRGCFGPVAGVDDFGAKFISAIAAMLNAESDAEIEELVNKIADPVGYFYRYSLAASSFRGKSPE